MVVDQEQMENLSARDMEAVLDFEAFLNTAGSYPPTPEKARELVADPEWREYLGVVSGEGAEGGEGG